MAQEAATARAPNIQQHIGGQPLELVVGNNFYMTRFKWELYPKRRASTTKAINLLTNVTNSQWVDFVCLPSRNFHSEFKTAVQTNLLEAMQ